MADKLMHIPNYDTHNYCSLQLVDETMGNSIYWTNTSKFNKSPQSC